MIPVPNPIPEPKDFDVKCRVKGTAWLIANPEASRPRDLWSPFRLELAKGFFDRCGYGAMWISSGTVDHYVSVDEDFSKTYEWNNYRYIEGWLNSSKKKLSADELLDPFDVRDGWFEIELPSLQLKLSDSIPAEFRVRAENTLRLLPLRDDERIIRQRRAWLEIYEQGTPLTVIRAKAPLIALASEKRSEERRVG